jgi:serine phosphatase RsbU (regulator of sigma subunit)
VKAAQKPVRIALAAEPLRAAARSKPNATAIPSVLPVTAGGKAQAELVALRRERSELHQAMFEAAQVQRKLCAPRDLCHGSLEIAGEMFPVRHLSGDFYKIFRLGSDIGVAVGDIAGKGLRAGLWLSHMMGLLRICTREHSDPAAAVAAMNRELCEAQPEPAMTALFLGRVNPQTGELSYCNAGQPGALLLRQDGTVESLQAGGPMLGAVALAKFETGRVTLQAGETLVAYSDGVVECCNANEEEFGTNRLATAAAAAGSATANRALFSTLGAVLDFAGGRPPGDDLTLLVLHRRASALVELAAPQVKLMTGGQTGQGARNENVFDPLN